MPWSKTPVVSLSLAIAQPGLLPSAQSNASAFTCTAGLSSLMDHNYTFFGAQYRACTLVPSSFVLPLPGLHVDFSTDLVASLWSGGTLTMCDHPLGNINQFHPDLRGIPRFRVYLGTRIDLLGGDGLLPFALINGRPIRAKYPTEIGRSQHSRGCNYQAQP